MLMCLFAACPLAQGSAGLYPTRPIRWIVPLPPGGPADLLGCMIGQKLAETWLQPVLVDNRPGAAGNLGVELAAIITSKTARWAEIVTKQDIRAD
jgi:tripartite-type tricarboxylate transporter receptor subunit TctC